MRILMSLRSRIILLSVLATVVVAGILETIGMVMLTRANERIADAVLTGNRLIWEQLLQDEQERIAGGIEAFDKEFELRTAIKQRDHAQIAEYANRYVNLSRDGGRYELLQIYDPDRRLLYSSSQRLGLSGISGLLSAVSESSRRASGILLGDDGRAMAVVAFPVNSRRGLLGIGAYAKPLDGVLERFAQRSGFGIALADGQSTLIADANFPQVGDLETFVTAPGVQGVDIVQAAGARFVLSSQPVRDLAGDPVVQLLVARDDTERLNELEVLNIAAQLGVLLSIIAGVGVLWLLLRRYLAPMQQTAEAASAIADGDLTVALQAQGVAEIGVLERAMNDMVQKLRGLVGQIATISSEVREFSVSMNAAIADTHQDLNDQTVNVEAISLALEQMAASIDEVLRVTEQTAATAYSIEAEAAQGHQLLHHSGEETRSLAVEIDEVTHAIEGLHDHVEAVSGIVNVIKSIAEQTNLLALNAAIEAARAGEQGRGFAVVAGEVRGLASRTQDSTQEIEAIIERLQHGAGEAVTRIASTRGKVHDNVAQTAEVLNRFEEIKASISELVAMGHSASSAVQQQSVVAREVSNNMRGIREAAERTQTRSDTLLSTSGSLQALSITLERMTHKFRY
jgi:methyl-accepting chemotaxis protein